jgi:Nitrogen regulatory protein P-II
MKLLVVAVDKESEADVLRVLEDTVVSGYSIIPRVLGRGATGAHLGTRAFPGENAMVVALVPTAKVEPLKESLAALHGRLRPGQGLTALVLDADRLV